MLKNDFYTIVETNKQEPGSLFVLHLNERHAIYDGHFPGHPVVPGVCFLQMIIELAEVVFKKKMIFLKADELKFLQPVNPAKVNMLQADFNYTVIEETNIQVTVVFYQQLKQPCVKCKIVLGTA